MISAIVIALALLGFIAMDAFTGRSSLFGGGPSNTIGRINGERVDAGEFRELVNMAEERLKSQGYPSNEAGYQAVEQAWEQKVNMVLQEEELEKLGLQLSKKEMADLLYGPNPSPIATQYLTAPNSPYDPQAVRENIRQTERSGNAQQRTALKQLLEYIEQSKLVEKYNSLISNSANVPKWVVEKRNADNSQMAAISFVRKPFTDIPDSSVKVTDQEIKDYINKHKDQFKQEESRSISYVSFSAAPSAADTAEVRTKLAGVSQNFLDSKEPEQFLLSQGSDFPYSSNFILAKDIQLSMKDSILKTPVGSVYGPYLDKTHYVLAKMIASEMVPDSVDVRHILVKTADYDQQSGRMIPVMDTSVARIRIDSIEKAIQGGANFDTLCLQYSDDGTRDKGGVYTNVIWNKMVPNFNDFIFTKGPAAKGVVYTEYGFHYIEVLKHHGGSKNRAVKVAYLAKPILTGAETENTARNMASQFAGNSRDEKSFNETFEKELRPKGYIKGVASDILPNAYSLPGLGTSREFVRKIYEAKRGDAIQPEKVGMAYVVAVVTEVNEKGTTSVAKARTVVESALRNTKKAEVIRKQLGAISTLEAAAASLGKPIETSDSLRITGGGSLGFEPRVVGAVFNPANRGKVITSAIEGRGGVYVVRVDNVVATASSDASVAEQRKAEIDRAKQQAMYASPINSLKVTANIKDNRSKQY